MREVTRRTLEAFGYRVISCATGAEAIVRFRASQGEVRLVLTDIMMPEMDGPVLARALWAIAPQIPIVGISGVCDSTAKQRLLLLPFSSLVAKPFTIGELLTAVHKAIGAPVPGTEASAGVVSPTPADAPAGS